jgi:hypothetical protein
MSLKQMNPTTHIVSPISLGELVDKITILEIKSDRISDQDKLRNITIELNALSKTLSDAVLSRQREELENFQIELKAVNLKLWIIEDEIRNCERMKDFGGTFIELARSVYFTNDVRAEIKKRINLQFGSSLVEEKSYNKYD